MYTHEITIDTFPYFSTPIVYKAKCSCGKYNSGKHADKRSAEKAGNDHVKSKS